MLNTTDNNQIMLDRLAEMAVTKFRAKVRFPQLCYKWTDAKQGPNAKTYLVPKIGELDANFFSETGKVIPQESTTDKIEIAVETYESTFTMSAEAASSEIGAREAQFVDRAVEAIRKQVDLSMLKSVALDAALTQETGTYGTALTRAGVLAAKKYMDDAEVDEELRYLVLSTQTDADLRADTDYKAMGIYSRPDVITSGRLPDLEGFKVLTSPRIHAPQAGHGASLAFTPMAIGTVFPDWTPKLVGGIMFSMAEMDGLRIGMIMENISGTLGGSQVSVFCKFGAKLINPVGAVLLKGK